MKNFKVITLCGSTKFKDKFLQVAEYLTLKGNIVLMPHCYTHADNIELDQDKKEMMERMHRQMIDMSDGIYVINVDGYIGESTASEIRYADDNDKDIQYHYTKF